MQVKLGVLQLILLEADLADVAGNLRRLVASSHTDRALFAHVFGLKQWPGECDGTTAVAFEHQSANMICRFCPSLKAPF